MKKIALVAAIAALAAPAVFAQSSVTLWGRINTTVESQKEGAAGRKVVVANNASRLGFKGQEDLGGGPEGELRSGAWPGFRQRYRSCSFLGP